MGNETITFPACKDLINSNDAGWLSTGNNTKAAPYEAIFLKGKLHPLTVPPDCVAREVLQRRLDAFCPLPLILVSAPAGYGKSTLISCWLRQGNRPFTWLSLDESDGDLRQFLNYFLAAVRAKFPSACEASMRIARAPVLPPMATIATVLANDLEVLENPLVIVLDDYHCIPIKSEVNELLQRLLKHPPIPMHLILICRCDPALQLYDLRAAGQMFELRMHDLRFSVLETRVLMGKNLRYTISDAGLAHLDKALEGWPAGLRLASLAMRDSCHPEQYIKKLNGGLQSIQAYLIREVIHGLPHYLSECLVKSAILGSFCASLFDAVCVAGAAGEMKASRSEILDTLRAHNLFIVALDSPAQWYRYHSVFRVLLNDQLSEQFSKDEISALHMRASVWFECHAYIVEAIHHAVVAGEVNVATRILESHYHQELDQNRWHILEQCLAQFPNDLTSENETVMFVEAALAFHQRKIAKLTRTVDVLDSVLSNKRCKYEKIVELNFYRAFLHFCQGNMQLSEREFEMASLSLPDGKKMLLSESECYCSVLRYMNGKETLAIESITDRILHSGDPFSESLLLTSLAFIYWLAANLPRMRFAAKRVRDTSLHNSHCGSKAWSHYIEGAACLHTGELEEAINQLSGARQHLYTYDARAAVDTLAGLALAYQMSGQIENATNTVKEMTRFADELNDPNMMCVAEAAEARIALLQGDKGKQNKYLNWAKTELPIASPIILFVWLEVPQITQIRVLLNHQSMRSLRQASDLLNSLYTLCETMHLSCQCIELDVLKSLVLDRQGHIDEALVVLRRALAMAEPGGWSRPFVEAGRPISRLIKLLNKEQSLRSDFSRAFEQDLLQVTRLPDAVDQSRGLVWLADPLTKRELEILQLLANRLQNKEIARELFVEASTVKTHLKNLYQKLGVSSRLEASKMACDVLAASNILLTTNRVIPLSTA